MLRTIRKSCSATAFAAIGLTAAAAAETPPAQIAVSPSRVEVAVGGSPIDESVRLFNFGDHDVSVSVSVATWDLDEENRVRLVAPDEQSLDQWMVVTPLRFTVPAGESQVVRFSIRPRVRPTDGEHRAMIYFDQDLPAEEEASMRVRFRVGVAVYGFAGEVARTGELHALRTVAGENSMAAVLDVSSTGNAHVRFQGQYAIWPRDAFPGGEATSTIDDLGEPGTELPGAIVEAGFLPSTPILGGTRRELAFRGTGALAPGRYVLDLNGTLGGVAIDRSVEFVVPTSMVEVASTSR